MKDVCSTLLSDMMIMSHLTSYCCSACSAIIATSGLPNDCNCNQYKSLHTYISVTLPCPVRPRSALNCSFLICSVLCVFRPFGVVLLNTLQEGSNRLLIGRGRGDRGREKEGKEGKDSLGGDAQVVQRAANVLSLLFVHGGMLASELSTVINTSHTSLHGKYSSAM